MTDRVLGLDQFMKLRVEDRDSKHLDPRERADFVNTLILLALDLTGPKEAATNPLYWDLVCYATEFLNLFALQSEDEELLAIAKAWSTKVYSLHYSYEDGMNALGPDRGEYEKVWKKRLERLKTDEEEEDG